MPGFFGARPGLVQQDSAHSSLRSPTPRLSVYTARLPVPEPRQQPRRFSLLMRGTNRHGSYWESGRGRAHVFKRSHLGELSASARLSACWSALAAALGTVARVVCERTGVRQRVQGAAALATRWRPRWDISPALHQVAQRPLVIGPFVKAAFKLYFTVVVF